MTQNAMAAKCIRQTTATVNDLPLESLEKILHNAVVDEAMSGSSLNAVFAKFSAVCKRWHQIISGDTFSAESFRRKAQRTLWSKDATRRYREAPTKIRCRGLNFGGVELLTYLDSQLFTMTTVNAQIQVWDTDSYSKVRASIVFHMTRQMTITGRFIIDQPDVLVGCDQNRKLFLLDLGGVFPHAYVLRINPAKGNIETVWMVGKNCISVTTGNGKLVLTYSDRLEVRDVNSIDGAILTTIPVTAPTPSSEIKEGAAVPGGDRYLVCCQSAADQFSLDKGQLMMLANDGLKVADHVLDNFDHIRGYLADQFGSVLLLTTDHVETTLRVLQGASLRQTRALCLFADADRDWNPGNTLWEDGDEDESTEMWLDKERGLLFIWTIYKSLLVYQVMVDALP